MGYTLPTVLFEPPGTGALAANQKSKRHPALCSSPCSGTSYSVTSPRASLPPATPDCGTCIPHSAHTTGTCFERPWEAKTDFTFKTLMCSNCLRATQGADKCGRRQWPKLTREYTWHSCWIPKPRWLSKPLFYKIPASIHGLPLGTGMASSLRNARVGWHSPPSLAQSQLLDSELTFAFLFPLGDVSQDQRLCSGQPPPGLSGPDRGAPVILARVHCGPRLYSDLPCLG